MPSSAPATAEPTTTLLKALGERLRARRKDLHLSATVAAEAAGISRVTWHRIEKGEPSVTMGAWSNAMAALGLVPAMMDTTRDAGTGAPGGAPANWIPARILLSDFPQLKALAWQVHGTDALTPAEALDIYERNARHLDMNAMADSERALVNALRLAFSTSASYPDGRRV